jgi:hypothetical protein
VKKAATKALGKGYKVEVGRFRIRPHQEERQDSGFRPGHGSSTLSGLMVNLKRE